MAILESVHGVDVSACKILQSVRRLDVQDSQLILSAHGIDVSAGVLESVHGIDVEATAKVERTHGVDVEAWGQAFYNSFISPTANPSVTGTDPRRYKKYSVRLLLHNTGDSSVDDLTEYLVSWDISQARSSTATMNVQLVDKDRSLRPILQSGDSFYEKFRGDSVDQNYNIRRYWTLEIETNGEVWTSPWFLLLEYSWSQTDSTTVSLRFSDLSELMNRDNYSYDDFISGGTQIHTAQSIIRTLLNNINTKHSVQFTDYPVAKFSPKGGKLKDYVEKLLYVRQAEWRFSGDTFIAQDRNYSPSGPAHWKFVDIYDITSIDVRYSVVGLINEIIIKKVEQSNILGESDCVGGNCIGEQTVSLSSPANLAGLVIEEIVNSADSGNFAPTWFGPGGEFVGSGWAHSGAPASSVKWVYEPQIFTGAGTPFGVSGPEWTPRYRAVVYGKPQNDNPLLPSFDPSYTITIKNSNSQALYGVKPAPSPIEDELIPNAEAAEYLGRKLIEEAIRTTNMSSWQGLCLPFLEPMQMVEVSARVGGIDSLIFYVESVQKQGTADSATMSVEMSYYQLTEG